MYQYLLIIIIFSIVLFFYIHIYFHYKTSSDLEIYEIHEPNKEDFNKICDLRQPVLFTSADICSELTPHFNIKNINTHFSHFDINIRNCNANNETPNMHLYTSYTFEDGIKMLKSNKFIYSENNSHFLEESNLHKLIKQTDDMLQPSFLIKSTFDLIIGSQCITPLKFNVSYRTFILPIEDEVIVKLVPPRYSSLMSITKDYEYFQFLSNNNLWLETDNKKIKNITFTLYPGQILFIPAYWFYSLHVIKPNAILVLQYYSIMNYISISPDIILYLLQQQNIKYKTPCLIKRFNNNNISIDCVENKKDIGEKDIEKNDIEKNDIGKNCEKKKNTEAKEEKKILKGKNTEKKV